ncbi:integral membrane protein [Streptomyces davaonensis JCM 4913]|uniref:Integral membrane protein n=1 Tax=Streptomyces davaonensis (strain DSM 101723 / JCM 4913 / KCC S-0913 / 768) TaxID=1214101 RepID=K4R9C6_STRDJ|nr:hypothetical protein [Streptomyces davaonensis]CCK29284.1 integral membrane protein [Streptomyces davaonensis JCM 4913]
MGIESDQVVYEYLSRVGDVAQQRQLPSATRMRLVSELRNEIDRRRAKVPVDSPAAVRRIIDRLGTPDEVVTAAGATGGAPQAPAAAVPVQPDGEEKRPRRIVPRPRRAETDSPAADVPSPPHLARADELGDSTLQPDWWRVESSPFGGGDEVPGFVGGVEIPELLRPPPPKEEKKREQAPAVVERADEEEAEEAPARRRLLGLALPARKSWQNPLLLLAAVLLLTGAVIGNLIVLILGWLLAYGSRRLTDAEKKGAVLVLPGLAATAGIVWLWGRTEGRWGEPIVDGGMNDAIAETWPWVVRGAAVASALYLVWRSQRQK